MCSDTKSEGVCVRACVIGAGPTGLVAARYLLEKGYDVVVYEQDTGVGGTFRNKVYDATTLVSSKTITSFSDLRMGEGVERELNGVVCDHPSAERYVQYLDTYARLNGVTDKIQFGTKVLNIVKKKRRSYPEGCRQRYAEQHCGSDIGSGNTCHNPMFSAMPRLLLDYVYTVHYTQDIPVSPNTGTATGATDTVTSERPSLAREFDCVVVCSGVHSNLNIPTEAEIPGLKDFREDANTQEIHSSDYNGDATQKESLFGAGKNVLVVGCGETAMDIAYRAVQMTNVANVGLLARRGFLSIPYQMGSDRVHTDAQLNSSPGSITAVNNSKKLPSASKDRIGMKYGLGKDTQLNGKDETSHTLINHSTAIRNRADINAKTTATTHASAESSRPLDVFITNMFEHSYEHPLVHRLQLRWVLSTYVIRFGMGLIGSSWGCNQWAGAVEDVKRGHHIINKSSAAMPHINAGVKAVRYGMWGRLWEYLWGEKDLKPISVYGGKGLGIERIVCAEDSSSSVSGEACSTQNKLKKYNVEFADGRVYEGVDTIVFATGYRQYFPFLQDRSITRGSSACVDDVTLTEDLESIETGGNPVSQSPRTKNDENKHCNDSSKEQITCSDKYKETSGCAFTYRHAAGEATLPLMSSKTGFATHYIVNEDTDPGIAYIGFVRPNVGAIPPMSELQIQWYLQFIEGGLDRCPRERYTRDDGLPSYLLVGRKYQYGVDYGNYMHRVAEDMGSAPTLTHITRSIFKRPTSLLTRVRSWLRIMFTYCLGQAMVPLFRLQGPYESTTSGWDVVEGELYSVCVRRGLMENIGLLVMSVFFLALNIGFLGVEVVLVILGYQKQFEGFARYM